MIRFPLPFAAANPIKCQHQPPQVKTLSNSPATDWSLRVQPLMTHKTALATSWLPILARPPTLPQKGNEPVRRRTTRYNRLTNNLSTPRTTHLDNDLVSRSTTVGGTKSIEVVVASDDVVYVCVGCVDWTTFIGEEGLERRCGWKLDVSQASLVVRRLGFYSWEVNP